MLLIPDEALDLIAGGYPAASDASNGGEYHADIPEDTTKSGANITDDMTNLVDSIDE